MFEILFTILLLLFILSVIFIFVTYYQLINIKIKKLKNKTNKNNNKITLTRKKSMPLLEEKAAQLAQNVKTDHLVTFDPMMILTLIQLLTSLISQFANGCKLSPSQAVAKMNKPNILDRFRLRRLIRQHDLQEHSDELHASLLKIGKVTTEDEVTKLYTEVQEG